MGGLNSVPATTVPAFMLCDGHFELDQSTSTSPYLQSFCGWVRFEGHGAFVVRQRETSANDFAGSWSILDGETIQLVLPSGAPASILMVQEGPRKETVTIIACDANSVRHSGVFTFVPEEDH